MRALWLYDVNGTFLSVFSPLLVALYASIKYCHWLVCRSSLYLSEKGPRTHTFCSCTRINICLLDVFPCSFSTKDIVNFFLIKFHFNNHFFFYHVNIWACFAVKSVICYCFFNEQYIAASRTKYHYVLIKINVFLYIFTNQPKKNIKIIFFL